MIFSAYEPAMREAVALAYKGRFATAPNPCVGAVLVRDGAVVAGGFHERHCGPHAEINALADAAAKSVDPATCDLVVTLEPCNHHGKTPPCTESILKAGIRRVIVGSPDPCTEAAGGAEFLRSKGIEVISGVLAHTCADLLADFTTWQTTNLPYIILKLAATLDGRIATRTGHSQWISCERTRLFVHELRRRMGAIIVGGNTFYADNPRLTARSLPGSPPVEKQPLAVVVTSRLPDPGMPSFLLQERPAETIFWTTVAAAASRSAAALRKMGVRVLGLKPAPRADSCGHGGMRAELDLKQGLAMLREECGCLYAMCEGGGRLGLSLLERRLAEELHLHLSPRILADNEAVPLFNGHSPMQIDDGVPLRFLGSRMCDRDLVISLRPAGTPGCDSRTDN